MAREHDKIWYSTYNNGEREEREPIRGSGAEPLAGSAGQNPWSEVRGKIREAPAIGFPKQKANLPLFRNSAKSKTTDSFWYGP